MVEKAAWKLKQLTWEGAWRRIVVQLTAAVGQ